MTNPSVRKLSGLLVSLSVGDVYFASDNAFQKFWNAQSDEVRANLTVNNLPSEPASSTASTGKGKRLDSQSDNQP